ncbi:hypothetical protein [Streptomyces sp. NRRL F-5630]|uniref:hypothetical protein n=1 Tax=Streptomyces sp. NRRL F-5630 TaxID=1463864 RepID=UPI0004C8E87A|nr:hypothetical protein [Streptomyces sp. NRRL F-5630]
MAYGNLLSTNVASIETDTTGWTALTNTSAILARFTGGTSGGYCLRWTATASGDSQVGTAARVPVTAGAEYWACASVFPPIASASARIEVRWYSSAGTLVSTSTGPTTTGPSPGTWFQVGVIATAPTGATTAMVVVRSTATAASQPWYLDRVHLGLTADARTKYSLLPWLSESAETGTSGWTADANCALGVASAAVSAYQSLAVTALASGDLSAGTTPAVPVSPGTEYLAALWVQTATTATLRPTIQWRDSTGAVIAATSVDWAPSTTWARVVAIGVAPAGAATARVLLTTTATAAGQSWAVDGVVLQRTQDLAQVGNLLPYGDASFETSVTGWYVTGATRSRSSVQKLDGTSALRLDRDGSSEIVVSLSTPVPVTAGRSYEVSAPLWRSDGSGQSVVRLDWLDASSAVIRTRSYSWSGLTERWQVGPSSDRAPTGAVALRPTITFPPGAGSTTYLDRIYIGEGGLSVVAEESAARTVSLRVSGLTVGSSGWRWRLERLLEGQAPAPVRGYTGDLIAQTIDSDVVVVPDHEAPLGVPTQWQVTVYNPSGPGEYGYISDALTLPADPDVVWIKDPTLPARSTSAVVQTLPDWQRAARQGVYEVRGRATPVVISDVRSSATGTLTLTTETAAERDALWWVLDAGSTILLQFPPGWREPDAYVAVGDVTESHIVDLAEYTDRAWSLSLTVVDRPVGGLVGSVDRTWASASTGGTWSETTYPFTTWLAFLTGGAV